MKADGFGFRPGFPEDYIKTTAPTEWIDLNHPAPNFESFLLSTFDGNQALVDYLQRLLGYCTTGLTVDHIFPIFYGEGRNGKGTLLELIAYVMGPYSGPTQAELILKQKEGRRSGGPTSDILYLRGKRMVWGSETDAKRKINEGMVKWLTGDDTLTGRGMYAKDQISFPPTHKIFLLTNHLPGIDPSSYSLVERLHPIPFLLSFIADPKLPHERKAEKYLREKLKAESSGILAWLVRGCLAWQKEGLNPPKTVRAALADYLNAEDVLKQFVEEKCITGDGMKVGGAEFYKGYREWSEKNGMNPLALNQFGVQMKKRFKNSTNPSFYHGVSLRLLFP